MTQEILNQVEGNSIQVQDMVKSIIDGTTQELDDYISSVKDLFLNDRDVPNSDLNKILLKIPTYIYYLTEVSQRLDIRKGVSAESAKFSLNNSLLGVTGTVAEKQAKAENATISERLVQLAYKMASNTLQAKINGAMEILNSVKRVQQCRMEEMRLTKQAGDSVAF